MAIEFTTKEYSTLYNTLRDYYTEGYGQARRSRDAESQGEWEKKLANLDGAFERVAPKGFHDQELDEYGNRKYTFARQHTATFKERPEDVDTLRETLWDGIMDAAAQEDERYGPYQGAINRVLSSKSYQNRLAREIGEPGSTTPIEKPGGEKGLPIPGAMPLVSVPLSVMFGGPPFAGPDPNDVEAQRQQALTKARSADAPGVLGQSQLIKSGLDPERNLMRIAGGREYVDPMIGMPERVRQDDPLSWGQTAGVIGTKGVEEGLAPLSLMSQAVGAGPIEMPSTYQIPEGQEGMTPMERANAAAAQWGAPTGPNLFAAWDYLMPLMAHAEQDLSPRGGLATAAAGEVAGLTTSLPGYQLAGSAFKAGLRGLGKIGGKIAPKTTEAVQGALGRVPGAVASQLEKAAERTGGPKRAGFVQHLTSPGRRMREAEAVMAHRELLGHSLGAGATFHGLHTQAAGMEGGLGAAWDEFTNTGLQSPVTGLFDPDTPIGFQNPITGEGFMGATSFALTAGALGKRQGRKRALDQAHQLRGQHDRLKARYADYESKLKPHQKEALKDKMLELERRMENELVGPAEMKEAADLLTGKEKRRFTEAELNDLIRIPEQHNAIVDRIKEMTPIQPVRGGEGQTGFLGPFSPHRRSRPIPIEVVKRGTKLEVDDVVAAKIREHYPEVKLEEAVALSELPKMENKTSWEAGLKIQKAIAAELAEQKINVKDPAVRQKLINEMNKEGASEDAQLNGMNAIRYDSIENYRQSAFQEFVASGGKLPDHMAPGGRLSADQYDFLKDMAFDLKTPWEKRSWALEQLNILKTAEREATKEAKEKAAEEAAVEGVGGAEYTWEAFKEYMEGDRWQTNPPNPMHSPQAYGKARDVLDTWEKELQKKLDDGITDTRRQNRIENYRRLIDAAEKKWRPEAGDKAEAKGEEKPPETPPEKGDGTPPEGEGGAPPAAGAAPAEGGKPAEKPAEPTPQDKLREAFERVREAEEGEGVTQDIVNEFRAAMAESGLPPAEVKAIRGEVYGKPPKGIAQGKSPTDEWISPKEMEYWRDGKLIEPKEVTERKTRIEELESYGERTAAEQAELEQLRAAELERFRDKVAQKPKPAESLKAEETVDEMDRLTKPALTSGTMLQRIKGKVPWAVSKFKRLRSRKTGALIQPATRRDMTTQDEFRDAVNERLIAGKDEDISFLRALRKKLGEEYAAIRGGSTRTGTQEPLGGREARPIEGREQRGEVVTDLVRAQEGRSPKGSEALTHEWSAEKGEKRLETLADAGIRVEVVDGKVVYTRVSTGKPLPKTELRDLTGLEPSEADAGFRGVQEYLEARDVNLDVLAPSGLLESDTRAKKILRYAARNAVKAWKDSRQRAPYSTRELRTAQHEPTGRQGSQERYWWGWEEPTQAINPKTGKPVGKIHRYEGPLQDQFVDQPPTAPGAGQRFPGPDPRQQMLPGMEGITPRPAFDVEGAAPEAAGRPQQSRLFQTVDTGGVQRPARRPEMRFRGERVPVTELPALARELERMGERNATAAKLAERTRRLYEQFETKAREESGPAIPEAPKEGVPGSIAIERQDFPQGSLRSKGSKLHAAQLRERMDYIDEQFEKRNFSFRTVELDGAPVDFYGDLHIDRLKVTLPGSIAKVVEGGKERTVEFGPETVITADRRVQDISNGIDVPVDAIEGYIHTRERMGLSDRQVLQLNKLVKEKKWDELREEMAAMDNAQIGAYAGYLWPKTGEKTEAAYSNWVNAIRGNVRRRFFPGPGKPDNAMGVIYRLLEDRATLVDRGYGPMFRKGAVTEWVWEAPDPLYRQPKVNPTKNISGQELKAFLMKQYRALVRAAENPELTIGQGKESKKILQKVINELAKLSPETLKLFDAATPKEWKEVLGDVKYKAGREPIAEWLDKELSKEIEKFDRGEGENAHTVAATALPDFVERIKRWRETDEWSVPGEAANPLDNIQKQLVAPKAPSRELEEGELAALEMQKAVETEGEALPDVSADRTASVANTYEALKDILSKGRPREQGGKITWGRATAALARTREMVAEHPDFLNRNKAGEVIDQDVLELASIIKANPTSNWDADLQRRVSGPFERLREKAKKFGEDFGAVQTRDVDLSGISGLLLKGERRGGRQYGSIGQPQAPTSPTGKPRTLEEHFKKQAIRTEGGRAAAQAYETAIIQNTLADMIKKKGLGASTAESRVVAGLITVKNSIRDMQKEITDFDNKTAAKLRQLSRQRGAGRDPKTGAYLAKDARSRGHGWMGIRRRRNAYYATRSAKFTKLAKQREQLASHLRAAYSLLLKDKDTPTKVQQMLRDIPQDIWWRETKTIRDVNISKDLDLIIERAGVEPGTEGAITGAPPMISGPESVLPKALKPSQVQYGIFLEDPRTGKIVDSPFPKNIAIAEMKDGSYRKIDLYELARDPARANALKQGKGLEDVKKLQVHDELLYKDHKDFIESPENNLISNHLVDFIEVWAGQSEQATKNMVRSGMLPPERASEQSRKELAEERAQAERAERDQAIEALKQLTDDQIKDLPVETMSGILQFYGVSGRGSGPELRAKVRKIVEKLQQEGE